MKTTLNLPDDLVRRLKVEAARRNTTMTALVEAALRLLLEAPPPADRRLPALPTLEIGELLVDVSDRDQLYRVLEDG